MPSRLIDTSPEYPGESGSYDSFGNATRDPLINIDRVFNTRAPILCNLQRRALWTDARKGYAAAQNEKSYLSASLDTSAENRSSDTPVSRWTTT